MSTIIKNITAREILDSRGDPTVEVKVTFGDQGQFAVASVPSGASTGIHEALELRDGDSKRYSGKGVLHVCENVKQQIAKKLIGLDVTQQQKIDQMMIDLDGTADKEKLGANAILGVSLACARAGSLAKNVPLYEYIKTIYSLPIIRYSLPIPLFNIFNEIGRASCRERV